MATFNLTVVEPTLNHPLINEFQGGFQHFQDFRENSQHFQDFSDNSQHFHDFHENPHGFQDFVETHPIGRSLNSNGLRQQNLHEQTRLKTLPANTFEHVVDIHPEHGFFGDRIFSSVLHQGPLAMRNGLDKTGLVHPKLALPTLNNETFMQLPVLWTALSLALGLEVQGEIIRGLPCIKRLNQLFCRSAGSSYPSEKIEMFIDQHKALMKRMYGEFLNEVGLGEIIQGGRGTRSGRSITDFIPDGDVVFHQDDPRVFNESIINHVRQKRLATPGPTSNSDRVDACESKMEVVSPYWATNSAGHIRAIVNTNDFSQVIHQEVCTKQSTKRCNNDCGCEQKFKWHRMLAFDAEDDCRGVFMDWFLFPSCCVCRCDPL